MQKNVLAPAPLVMRNKLNKVYYTFEYDPINDWTYANWIGFVTVEEVIVACERGLSLLESTRCPRLLNDNSQITGPWSGANDWIVSTWMPRALKAGLTHIAHVVSPNVFGAMTANQLVSKVDGFEMRLFKSREEAESWLRRV